MGNVSTKRNKSSKEIEKYTKPTGLYKSCLWSDKAVRRMILDGKIAPRYPGSDIKFADTQECPICFMYYPGGLNHSTCCKKLICTECLLQIKPPKQSVCCPFCNKNKYVAVYRGRPTVEEMLAEEKDEQLFAENAKQSTSPTSPEKKKVVLASAQDRKRIQEESMRQCTEAALEQTILAHRRGRPPAFVDSWHSTLNSSGDVAHVEQIMIMEAIRRSMIPETHVPAVEHSLSDNSISEDADPAGSGDDDISDEDENLRVAIALSMNAPQSCPQRNHESSKCDIASNSSLVPLLPAPAPAVIESVHIESSFPSTSSNPFDALCFEEKQIPHRHSDGKNIRAIRSQSWNPFDETEESTSFRLSVGE